MIQLLTLGNKKQSKNTNKSLTSKSPSKEVTSWEYLDTDTSRNHRSSTPCITLVKNMNFS